jgi:ABC-2 type transport system permease protein
MIATAHAASGGNPVRAFGAYLGLELRRAARNRRYLFFGIGFPVVFYLLYTGVLQGKNAGPADPAFQAFFLVSMAAYGMIGAALSSAVPIAQERATGWTRQLRITPLPSAAWVSSKLAVAYLTALPALGLVSLVAVGINHVQLAPATWVQLVGGLAVGVVPFAAFGLLIGYTFDPGSAQGAVTLTYLATSILGGLWAPVSTFPDGLATIARIMPTYHLANLGWTALDGKAPDPVDLLVLVAYGVAAFALVAWRYRTSEQRARG